MGLPVLGSGGEDFDVVDVESAGELRVFIALEEKLNLHAEAIGDGGEGDGLVGPLLEIPFEIGGKITSGEDGVVASVEEADGAEVT